MNRGAWRATVHGVAESDTTEETERLLTFPDCGGRGWEASPGKNDHLRTPSSTRSCRANAEIAQVRGKAQQEQAAYQASLRKEQLRVDALERTLEQKVTG